MSVLPLLNESYVVFLGACTTSALFTLCYSVLGIPVLDCLPPFDFTNQDLVQYVKHFSTAKTLIADEVQSMDWGSWLTEERRYLYLKICFLDFLRATDALDRLYQVLFSLAN
jgi:hypothetical protein